VPAIAILPIWEAIAIDFFPIAEVIFRDTLAAMANEPAVIGVAQAATVLKVSERQVRNMIEAKLIPAQVIGGAYIIRRSDLAKVPKDRKPGPKPKASRAKS
jgi:excisionase family DNA binding protein